MQEQQFSRVTNLYLARFHEILEEMIQGMTDAKLNDSISHNFIVQMVPHHMAAIEMSRNLLQYTTFIPLQQIALNIIEEQTKSIKDMKTVLQQCSCLQNGNRELCHYQGCFHEITRTMFSGMQNACAVNDINVSFMREMIPHHEGAVRMSKNALQFDICPGLVPILQAIITSQCKGIKQMEDLLKCI